MAFDYWVAAGSGDWSANGNWASAASPVDADTVMLDGRSSDSVTSNLTANTLDNFPSFIIQEGYGGMIGTAGAYLEAQADKLVFRGSGTLYYKSGTDGADKTDRVVIDTPSGNAFLGCNTSDMVIVEAIRGNVTMTSTITGITDLFVGDAKVTIQGGTTYPDVFVWGAGNVTCLPDVTNLYHFGTGTWTQIDQSEAITNMWIGPGAKLVYNGANNITLATVYDGGSLDLSRMGTEITITDLWRGRNATVKKSDSVIITNEHFL